MYKKKHRQLRVDHIGVIRKGFPVVSDACVRSFSQQKEPQMSFFYAFISVGVAVGGETFNLAKKVCSISPRFSGFHVKISRAFLPVDGCVTQLSSCCSN